MKRFIKALLERKKCQHRMLQCVPEFDRWKCVWCGHEERHKNLNDVV